MADGKKITMYGADWCGDCRRSKKVFERLAVAYRWVARNRYRLPGGPRAWAAALARELLVPWLAFEAWRGRNRIDWRGTDLAAGWQPGGDSPAGQRV